MRVLNRNLFYSCESQGAIEGLPNELFLEIFSYLTCKDLFQAFDNLNSRLCFLIGSTFIRFEYNEENKYLISSIKATQIKSMIMNDLFNFQFIINYLRSNHLTQLERLEFNFHDLESLRSIFSLIPQFNNLHYLHIYGHQEPKTIELKDFCQNIAELILSPPFFTKLRSIKLFVPSMISYYGYLQKPDLSSMLEYFSLHTIFLDDLALVITCLPRIKRVKIVYVTAEGNDHDEDDEDNLTNKSLKQMPENTSLEQLEIGVIDGVTVKVCEH